MIQFREGFYADIRVEDRSRTVIRYKAGELEEMKTRVEKQAFIRVYDGKMWYYASVTDVEHLQQTLDMWIHRIYHKSDDKEHLFFQSNSRQVIHLLPKKCH